MILKLYPFKYKCKLAKKVKIQGLNEKKTNFILLVVIVPTIAKQIILCDI